MADTVALRGGPHGRDKNPEALGLLFIHPHPMLRIVAIAAGVPYFPAYRILHHRELVIPVPVAVMQVAYAGFVGAGATVAP